MYKIYKFISGQGIEAPIAPPRYGHERIYYMRDFHITYKSTKTIGLSY